MIEQVIRYVLDVVFGLFTYALLRRIVPGWKGIDWASLLALFAFQFLWLLSYNLVFGGFSLAGAGVPFLLAATPIAVLKAAIWLFIIVVFAQAILSWVAPDGPLSGTLNALTFPFLRPI